MTRLQVILSVALVALLVSNADAASRSMSRLQTLAHTSVRLSHVIDKRCARSEATHSVFAGYMDEEVAHTLHEVLKRAKAKKYASVVVIERGTVEGAQRTAHSVLFERPLVSYKTSMGDDFVVDRYLWDAQDPVEEHKYTQSCRRVLPHSSEDVAACANKARAGGAVKKVLEGIEAILTDGAFHSGHADRVDATQSLKLKGTPNFQVYHIHLSAGRVAEKGTAVVIRAPEMGLQPALTQWFMSHLLLKALPNGLVNLFAIGASGAGGQSGFATGHHPTGVYKDDKVRDRKDDCPGCMYSVAQSLYVGGDYVGDRKFRSIISHQALAPGGAFVETEAATEEMERVESDPEPFYTNGKDTIPVKDVNTEHVTDARDAFERMGEESLDSDETELKLKIQTLANKSPTKDDTRRQHTSTTIDYFGGERTKLAAAALGLHSVQMEDAHVIKGFRETIEARKGANKVCAAGVWRVDCDPYSVTDVHAAKANAWMGKHLTITKAQYAKILSWAAAGMPMEFADANEYDMCWTDLDLTEDTTLFIRNQKPDGGDGCVSNPIFMEIATDMKADWEKTWKDNSDHPAATVFAGTPAEQATKACAAMWHYVDHHADYAYKAAHDKAVEDALKAARDKAAKDKEEKGEASLELDEAAIAEDAANSAKLYAPYVEALKAKIPKDGKAAQYKLTNCPLWLRGKWYFMGPLLKGDPYKPPKGYPFANGLKLNAGGTDRFFYKASNFAGLQRINHVLFNQVGDSDGFFPVVSHIRNSNRLAALCNKCRAVMANKPKQAV